MNKEKLVTIRVSEKEEKILNEYKDQGYNISAVMRRALYEYYERNKQRK